MRALPEGTIDPYLKTITLARGEKPLVRLHYYATHPQTPYGDGRASSDMRGRRPRRARAEGRRLPDLLHRLRRRHHDGQVQRRLQARPRRSWPSGCWPAWRLPSPPRSWLRPARSAGGPIRCCCPADRRRLQHGRLPRPHERPEEPRRVLRLYDGAVRVAFHQRSQQPIELSSLRDRQRAHRAPAGRADDLTSNCSRRASSRRRSWPWPDTATAGRAISAPSRRIARAATSRPTRDVKPESEAAGEEGHRRTCWEYQVVRHLVRVSTDRHSNAHILSN